MKKLITLLILPILFLPNFAFAVTILEQNIKDTAGATQSVGSVIDQQGLTCSQFSGLTIKTITFHADVTNFQDARIGFNSVNEFAPENIYFTDWLILNNNKSDYTFTFSTPLDDTWLDTCIAGGNSLEIQLEVNVSGSAGTVTYYGSATNNFIGLAGAGAGGTVADWYMIFDDGVEEFVRVGTGIYFFGLGNNTKADQTASLLTANVMESVGSVFPITILSISIFLAFYILQKIITMFGFATARVEKTQKFRTRKGFASGEKMSSMKGMTSADKKYYLSEKYIGNIPREKKNLK